MPEDKHSRLSANIAHDMVEADLDAAYALLYLAEVRSESGASDEARRALDDATAACSDALERLRRLDQADVRVLRPRLERMRSVIDGTRSRLKAA